jgi:hypothetical protein
MNSATMLRPAYRRPDQANALERIRGWVRQRFALSDETTILVTEITCAVPGCPPLETVAVFWTAAGRHHFKVFKPVADVVEDDLPPAFMKDALVAPDGIECSCC